MIRITHADDLEHETAMDSERRMSDLSSSMMGDSVFMVSTLNLNANEAYNSHVGIVLQNQSMHQSGGLTVPIRFSKRAGSCPAIGIDQNEQNSDVAR